MDSLSLIRETFAPLAGRHLIDIGCGPGLLAKALASQGVRVSGIDPGADAIAAATARVPGARFEIASAEALPFPDGGFDGALILNALHHVGNPRAALAEAARVTGPGAKILVVEPLAEGSFFAALRPIEDETAVRARAQEAIAAAIAAGEFTCARELTFERRETFDTLDAFLDRVAAVDQARRATIRDHRAVIAAVFEAAAERDAGGYALVQPLRAHVLVPIRKA